MFLPNTLTPGGCIATSTMPVIGPFTSCGPENMTQGTPTDPRPSVIAKRNWRGVANWNGRVRGITSTATREAMSMVTSTSTSTSTSTTTVTTMTMTMTM